ncbi:MAG TPA: TerB family tellurite resistance protein [Chitinophagaceae bacterium]|nr:TerB family tellurite resistance protein [Chitinophagaceae bacterium]
MFYEELYAELGKLFYQIAAADGKVAAAERKALDELVRQTWEPLESSTDEFGSDQADLIIAAFDFEEAEGGEESPLSSFEDFYSDNKTKFTPIIRKNILQTGQAIADSYRSKNKSEQKLLDQLRKIMTVG